MALPALRGNPLADGLDVSGSAAGGTMAAGSAAAARALRSFLMTRGDAYVGFSGYAWERQQAGVARWLKRIVITSDKALYVVPCGAGDGARVSRMKIDGITWVRVVDNPRPAVEVHGTLGAPHSESSGSELLFTLAFETSPAARLCVSAIHAAAPHTARLDVARHATRVHSCSTTSAGAATVRAGASGSAPRSTPSPSMWAAARPSASEMAARGGSATVTTSPPRVSSVWQSRSSSSSSPAAAAPTGTRGPEKEKREGEGDAPPASWSARVLFRRVPPLPSSVAQGSVLAP